MVHHCPNHYWADICLLFTSTTDLRYSPWNNPNHLLYSLFFKESSHIGMPVISHWGLFCPVSSPAPPLAWFWSVVIIQVIHHWEFLVLLLIPSTRHTAICGVWREIGKVFWLIWYWNALSLIKIIFCLHINDHGTIYVWCHYQNYSLTS